MRFRVFSVVAGLTLAVGLTVAVGTAGSARPLSSVAHGTVHAAPASTPDALSTLADNSTGDVGVGIVSQNFESSFDVYDSQGADDFKVPAGVKWHVKKVVIYGVYFNGSGPAASEDITFYNAAKKKPGTVKKAYAALAGADSGGTFTIKLPTAATLSGGANGKNYFVSAVANMDFGSGGEWAWEDSSNAFGTYDGPAWQNPGDGFATGCTTWTLEKTCVGDFGQHSKMFTLIGTHTP